MFITLFLVTLAVNGAPLHTATLSHPPDSTTVMILVDENDCIKA